MQFATTGSLRRAASAATVLSLWAAHIEIAKAQQFVSWVQPAGGNYSDSANWSPSVVPGANDSAFFDLNATYRVNLGNTSISEAYFRRGVVTLELTNFTYVVRSATAALNVYGGAPGQTATVVVRGGQIHADTLGDDVIIGLGLGTGTLRLDNANLGGAAAATRPDLFVGRSGTGTLIADGRSVLTLNTFTVADWSELGIGTATLTGPLVRLDAATGTIGNGGDATVALEQGAQATFTGALTIASQSTSESTLTLTESQLTAGQFVVGNSGFGGFFVNAGSEIAVTETQIGTLASGVGQAAISGSGSRWTTGGMRVGLAGRGELTIANGAEIIAGASAIGFATGGRGEVMITGAGSRWTSSNLLEVGASGRGDLTISDGGSLAVASLTLGVAAAGVGAAAVSGVDSQLRTTGNISVAALGNGSLTVADGAELYVGGGLTISDPAGAPIGTFRLDGGATYINGSAGFVNNGVFQHVDGLLQTRGNFRPNATNGELTINGTNVNDMPTVELVGSGPVENVTNVNVGLNRSGRLIVRNGRQLNIGPNELNIGGQVSGSGSVTVGPDSTIATNSSGSVNVGGIGPFSGGWGILNIHTGAIVDVGALRLFSAGTINLDGGLLAFDALGPLDGVVHWNAGTVRFDAATELTASLLTTWLGGDRTLRAGRTIASPQTLTLRTGMTVDGGSVNVATLAIAGGAGAGVGAGQLEIRSGIVQGSTVNNFGMIQLAGPLATLAATQINNTGTLRGTGFLQAGEIVNTVAGQVQIVAGERMRWGPGTSLQHINSGVVSVIGGEWQVDSALTNSASTGLISARNAILRFTELQNSGGLGITFGVTDIYGDVNNTGQINVSGGASVTFHDDVAQNGSMIVAAVGSTRSSAVFFGALVGGGGFTGGGDVYAFGDLRPGASPGSVAMGGNLFLGGSTSTQIELGGLATGQFDQLLVSGNLALGGTLAVETWNDYQLAPNQQYLIANVGGSLFGQFAGLGEGALVGNVGGQDLFITYAAGDGNDVALFTAAAGLPGDFDGNGQVDGHDFLRWQRGQSPNPMSPGDLASWQTNFGAGTLVAAGQGVPEPAAATLAALGALSCLGCRRTAPGAPRRNA